MAKYSFETTADVVAADYSAAIKSKVILITGVSPGGLGAQFALTIAKHSPGLLILAGRNIDKIQQTASLIKESVSSVPTRALKLDLNSLAQVREAAKIVNGYQEQIDILVNNAGIMAPPYTLSEDGIESQFATNHIGHFLFTNLIINKLISISDGRVSRVINVSSDGHRLSPVRFADWNFDNGKNYNPWIAYGQTKTANMLFSKSLAAKLGPKGLISVSLHPGVIPTTNVVRFVPDGGWDGLIKLDHQQGNRKAWGGFNFKTLEQGAATHVYASFDDLISTKHNNGAYLEDSRIFKPEEVPSWGRDEVEAEKLWKLSEQIVGQQFEY
ncbi:short-chain dehydrogenase [Talaromyces proteolyticus]|uniref:Short-chain dehydrogenase n=1 Tax=Talaromyces proteolyticus TaxID=1131652 RepID=A0AAD4KH43_9EURO|nr:short-chain dehydrogenase [Talaromyces proteolyticus]KAH8692014.1 short-chain dehydrogenase [Talaromyces proteolyticus]